MRTDQEPDATEGDLRLSARGLPESERPHFPHPEWTVGVVLIMAVVLLALGILGHPVWLLIGSPFILTLAVWVAVKIVEARRRRS